MTLDETLRLSRQAHKAARQAIKDGQGAKARALFNVALTHRLDARALDPDHTDPAWAEDAKNLHADIRWVRQSRAPHATEIETLKRFDAELEKYYRHQLGDSANTHSAVDLDDIAAAVRVPDRWQLETAGSTVCETCSHPEGQHVADGCAAAIFKDGDIALCDCPAYVASACRHVWQVTGELRTCAGCEQVERLTPAKALEDTDAFKQLQKEKAARS